MQQWWWWWIGLGVLRHGGRPSEKTSSQEGGMNVVGRKYWYIGDLCKKSHLGCISVLSAARPLGFILDMSAPAELPYLEVHPYQTFLQRLRARFSLLFFRCNLRYNNRLSNWSGKLQGVVWMGFRRPRGWRQFRLPSAPSYLPHPACCIVRDEPQNSNESILWKM